MVVWSVLITFFIVISENKHWHVGIVKKLFVPINN